MQVRTRVFAAAVFAGVLGASGSMVAVRQQPSTDTPLPDYDVRAGRAPAAASAALQSAVTGAPRQGGRRAIRLHPQTGAVRTMQFAGEGIFNSMAGDETGAIYVVTDHRLAAVEADATGAPVVRWSQDYDRGSRQKPGQLSQGSGTTPTLIGPDLVAITDNADPRMHVIFYRRT